MLPNTMEWLPEDQGLSWYTPGAHQLNNPNAFAPISGDTVSFGPNSFSFSESRERPVSAFDHEDQFSGEHGRLSMYSREGVVVGEPIGRAPVIQNTTPYPKGKNVAKKPKKAKISTTPKVRRPLSAYNLFFRDERERLLAVLPVRKEGKPRRSHGKLGFVAMAKDIGAKWRSVDAATKAHYDALAAKDKERYNREKEQAKQRQEEEKAQQIDLPSEETVTQVEAHEVQKSQGEAQAPLPMDEVWSLHDLAERLGPDGVNMMIRSFC